MVNYLKALWTALRQILFDISFELSGYIAYTTILSVFPFMIVLVALAGFSGQKEVVQTFIVESYQLLPDEVVETVSPIIDGIIHNPRQTLLTFAVIGILWLTSSGVEALRTGLNYGFHIVETRSFWFRRLQSLGFVLLAALIFLFSTVAIIIVPLVLEWLLDYFSLSFNMKITLTLLRYLTAFLVLILGITVVYRWLPNHTFRFKNCLPGALSATILWIGLANLYSLYLRNFGQYDIIYGSLGGIILTLIFLHASALIILYGARVNAALMGSFSYMARA